MKKGYARFLICLLCLGLIFSCTLNWYNVAIGQENSEETQKEEETEQETLTKSENESDETFSVKPKYYGIELKSDHIVFVIDITGSMERPLPPGVIEKAKKLHPKKGLKAIESGGGESNQSTPKAQNNKQQRKEGEGIDWDNIKTHLDLAKSELVEAIKSLDSKTYFVVITYNLTVKFLDKKQNNFVLATDANKQKMISEINKLFPQAGTDAFFAALMKALELAKDKKPDDSGSGKHGQVTGKEEKITEKKKEIPYDICFLTDGSPTVGEGKEVMPEVKAIENLEKLKKAMEKKNVSINAIGIGVHNSIMMQKIAEIGKGKYIGLAPEQQQPEPQK